MKRYSHYLVIFMNVLFISSCATIVKGSRQQVFFRGGPENGVTKVQTPDGTFDISNGSGSYLMTRSKPDVPVKVTCPNGTQKSGFIETKFDWLAGGAGNLLNGGWGWLVDPFTDKGYDISDVILSGYCDSSSEKTPKRQETHSNVEYNKQTYVGSTRLKGKDAYKVALIWFSKKFNDANSAIKEKSDADHRIIAKGNICRNGTKTRE